MVELQGLEPWTSSLQSWRSSQLSYSPVNKITNYELLITNSAFIFVKQHCILRCLFKY